MTASIPASRRSNKALGAKVAGAVGIVTCVVIIVVVWLGHGAIRGALDGMAADVDSGFDRAIAASDAVATRLDEAATSIGSIASDATELASTSSPSRERLGALQARLGQLADRYRELRTRYAEAREQAASIGATLRAIERIVPGARLPEGPTGILGGIDEKLQAIDATITSAIGSTEEAAPGQAAASALVERITALGTAVSGAATTAHDVSANLTSAQARASNAIDGLKTLLLIAGLAISVLFVWVLLLNVALWLLGRAWQRQSNATRAAPGTGSPPDSPDTAPPATATG